MMAVLMCDTHAFRGLWPKVVVVMFLEESWLVENLWQFRKVASSTEYCRVCLISVIAKSGKSVGIDC